MRDLYALRVQSSIVLGAATLLAFAVAARFSPTAGDWVAVALILAVGFPHGADDVAVMRRLFAGAAPAARRPWLLVAGYLAAMVATLAAWWWQPGVGLALFLAISIWHFGGDHVAALGLAGRTGRAYAWLWGTFALLAPLCWHPGELRPVVAAMLGVAPPEALLRGGAYLAALAGAGAGATMLAQWLRGRRVARARAEVAQLFLLAHCYVVFPSLWGFAFFFVGIHAATSVVNQLAWERGARVDAAGLARFLRRGAPYAALAAGAIAAGLYLGGATALTPAWLAGFFVLVSAFTTPHALVIHAASSSLSTAPPVPDAGGANSYSHA